MSPEQIDSLTKLHRAWAAACSIAREQPRRPGGDPRLLSAENAWHAAQEAARSAFAESRGWKRGGWFTLDQLRRGKNARHPRDPLDPPIYPVIDHAEFYRAQRRPVGIVSHSYRAEAAEQFAKANGLRVEELPCSWYNPGNCRAGLHERSFNGCVGPCRD